MMKILSQDESSKSGYWWYSSLWWNFISRMNIYHVKFVIIQVLMGTNTFCSYKLSCIRYFHYYSGWVGGWWEKLRIKTNSAQLKLKLGLSLAISQSISCCKSNGFFPSPGATVNSFVSSIASISGYLLAMHSDWLYWNWYFLTGSLFK